MYPLLEFLATLPQFYASQPAREVLHIGTGCVFSMTNGVGSQLPSETTLKAHWPGQLESEYHEIDGLDAVNFYMREARALGAEPASINRAIAALDHAMGGDTAFSAPVRSAEAYIGGATLQIG
ncbi:hypothetical protein [Paraburkholderia tropica]|uniref:hypothetical protein n=1 Tax=Paraburkholderia tropica TaxID=92647 RepID=UPI001F27D3FC|nr:hypothetical protein [Paraburkholderia tropica]